MASGVSGATRASSEAGAPVRMRARVNGDAAFGVTRSITSPSSVRESRRRRAPCRTQHVHFRIAFETDQRRAAAGTVKHEAHRAVGRGVAALRRRTPGKGRASAGPGAAQRCCCWASARPGEPAQRGGEGRSAPPDTNSARWNGSWRREKSAPNGALFWLLRRLTPVLRQSRNLWAPSARGRRLPSVGRASDCSCSGFSRRFARDEARRRTDRLLLTGFSSRVEIKAIGAARTYRPGFRRDLQHNARAVIRGWASERSPATPAANESVLSANAVATTRMRFEPFKPLGLTESARQRHAGASARFRQQRIVGEDRRKPALRGRAVPAFAAGVILDLVAVDLLMPQTPVARVRKVEAGDGAPAASSPCSR